MVPVCRIELLGGIRVLVGERVVDRFQTQKTAAMLAYLALRPGRPQMREALAEALWPEGDPVAIRNRLNQAVSSVRRQIHPPDMEHEPILLADHHTLSVNSGVVETDVEEFERHLRRAAKARDRAERVKHLQAATALYRGPLMEGFYEDWAMVERVRLEGLYLAALDDLVRAFSRTGEPEVALEYVQRKLAVDPKDETAHRDAMELLIRADRPRGALKQYESYALLLGGDQPSAEVEALRMRAERAANRTAVAAPKVKPKADPSSQVETPPAPKRLTLPRPLSGFFGRSEEVALLVDRLQSGARLVTVVGPAGCGKTRVALEAAVQLVEADGWDVITLGGGVPHDDGPVLVLADGADRPADELARATADLLAAHPNSHVLCASRSPLGADGEVLFPLAPLPIPHLEPWTTLKDLAASPSVALFVDRARAIRPDFQLTERTARPIAELCRHLEGLPLALELAAGWARVLTPTQMVEQFAGHTERLSSRRGGVPARHRSMDDAIEASYRMLSPRDQTALATLSVVEGPFRGAAAESLLGSGAHESLQALCDQSLVQVASDDEGQRFSLLGSVRAFAAARLDASSSFEAYQRLAHHYLEAAEAQACAAEDWPNLMRADAWFEEQSRKGEALRLAQAMAGLSERWGRMREALARLDRLEPPSDAREWAPWCTARGRLLWHLGAYVEGVGALQAALREFEQDGREPEALQVRRLLQKEAHRKGDFDEGRRLLELNAKAAEAMGDLATLAATHLSLGNMAVEQMDWGAAQAAYEKSLETARRLQDPDREGQALNNLGNLAVLRGDLVAAQRWLTHARGLFERAGYRWHLAMNHLAFSKLEHRSGNLPAARQNLIDAYREGQEEGLVLWRVVLQGALLLCEERRWDEAAQLFGYLDRLLEQQEGVHRVELEPSYHFRATLRSELGDVADELERVGRLLTQPQVMALLASGTGSASPL